SQTGTDVTLSNGGGAISVADNDNDPVNENQTVSQGTGITVTQTGQDFQVVNAAPDQVVAIADGGSGNITVGGTYPNLTIDVPTLNDADSDPTNENQTVSQGTGIIVTQTGQDFQVVNAAPDQVVAIADGGSGNITVGGTYPNLTIDVPTLNDADSSPTNEIQVLSQTGTDVTLSNGGGAISVADNDNDPVNENQTVSQGTGITVTQTGQDFQVVNAAPDQVVAIADGGSGNITVGGTYPNLTIDVSTLNDADSDPTNEIQNINEVLTDGNDAGGLLVKNIGTPVAGTDAANKDYVDNTIIASNPIKAHGTIVISGTTFTPHTIGATVTSDFFGKFTVTLNSPIPDALYQIQLSYLGNNAELVHIYVADQQPNFFTVEIVETQTPTNFVDRTWYFTILDF
ncbi:hypothetical protein OO009_12970, partial [Flavobacteriaceae bacterium KMM 6897]|nr:hypothetical protein [Flavobacteriaceae bacterium KMM 6897]